MKTNKLFSAMAVLTGVIIFTSCSGNDDIQGDRPAVKFYTGITATTKAVIDYQGNSLWEQDDPIGIYMVETGGTSVAERAENIRYIAASDGGSTSFNQDGTIIYYPVDETNRVDFIAYHPHNPAVTNYVYTVNLANQTSQTGIDLMYAKADNSGAGYDKTNTSPIDFKFEHKLVKLVINVTNGSGVTGNIDNVKITGMNTEAEFDLRGMDGLTDMSIPQGIEPCEATANAKYEAILLPAILDNTHTVEFTVGSDVYTWDMTNQIAKLEAGNIYIYNIVLTKNSVGVEGSIVNWIGGTAGDGIAD